MIDLDIKLEDVVKFINRKFQESSLYSEEEDMYEEISFLLKELEFLREKIILVNMKENGYSEGE